MASEHWSLRKTERRAAQVARIGKATGLGEDVSAVVDYALSYTISRLQEVEMYAPFDQEKLYDGTNHGLPAGARVRLSDGKLGHVVVGNPERSLIAYSADRITGCLEARDWFDNSTLLVCP